MDAAGGPRESRAVGASDVAWDCESLSQSSHLWGPRAFPIRLGHRPHRDFPIDLASTRRAGL